MKRQTSILIVALTVLIGVFVFFGSGKTVAAATCPPNTTSVCASQSTIENSDGNYITYTWENMSQITASFSVTPPTPANDKVTFTDSNGLIDYYKDYYGYDNDKNTSDTEVFYSGSNGNCTNGQSVISAQNFEPNNSGKILWRYIPVGYAVCETYPTGTHNTPAQPISINDPVIDGTESSKIMYKYDSSSNQITLVDSSVGSNVYKQSSSNPNVYTSGGTCAPIISVNSDGTAELWPLTSGGNGDKTLSSSDPGVSSVDEGGCDVYYEDNSAGYDSLNTEEGLAANLAGNKQDTSNGTIPVVVPGLQYVTVTTSSDGSTTCSVGGKTTACTTPAGTAASSGSDCQSSGGPFSWFVCAAINGVVQAENYVIHDVVANLLTTNPIDLSCASSTCDSSDPVGTATYKVWSSIRVYGDILLVIALIAAVIAETVGGGVTEAYTVKKMLPRILIAAVLINLSIYIVAGLEDIVNVLGSGIQSLIESPFLSAVGGGSTITVGGGTGVVAVSSLVGLTAVAGFTAGIAGIALLVVGTLLLAAIGILITLMFRQGILVLLIVLSPIAFALYCLPNTEQYFKKWWDLLFKTLLVYPIVRVVFAMADVTGIVMSHFGITPTLLAELMSIIAIAAPLFLIPFAFKLSGGAIGSINGAVSGVRDRVKAPIDNARKQIRAQRLERARNGDLFRGESALAQRSSRLAQGVMLAPKAGIDPRKMRARFQSARSTQTSAMASKAGESAAAQAVLGNDDLLTAALSGNRTEADARRYLENQGQSGSVLEQNVASITQARREMGRDAFNDAAVMALPGTGTGLAGGPAEMLRMINQVAGSDRARAGRLLNGARNSAERARRIDLYGSGFGDSLRSMNELYDPTSGATDNSVNAALTASALASHSAQEIGTARTNGLVNMQPAIVNRMADARYGAEVASASLASAQSGGNAAAIAAARAANDTAQRELARVMASTSSFLDVAGSSSSDNARVVGEIMGQDMGRGETAGGLIDRLEREPVYQQFKKVYSSAVAAGAVGGPAPGATGGGPAPGATPPPTGPTPSDIRLKTDIKLIDKLNDNVNLYSFKYVTGGPYYVGVMAQEVISTFPDAVGVGNDGYYYVDYAQLDFRMIELSEWETLQKTLRITRT